MRRRQHLPLLWLLSDARNDTGLDSALAKLPRGSGFVFRHYHLSRKARAARYRDLAAVAKVREHLVVVADEVEVARALGADGVYGPAHRIAGAKGLLKLATTHDGAELTAAERAGADGVFLSPVFPTRSHPGTQTLGIHGFHVLAQRARIAVIALGGMTAARAAELAWPRWGAIDGLASPQPA